jgi:hypothetical protein
MSRLRLNVKAMAERSKARTAQIVVGNTYFLSSFYDKDGCLVEVLSKSTKKNSAGWPSTVEVKVLEPLGDDAGKDYYAIGTVHTCNATNLYDKRSDASHTRRAF